MSHKRSDWRQRRHVELLSLNFVSLYFTSEGTGKDDLSPAVALVSQIHLLILKYEEDLTREERKSLAQYMARLGFIEDAMKFYPSFKVKEPQSLHYDNDNFILDGK